MSRASVRLSTSMLLVAVLAAGMSPAAAATPPSAARQGTTPAIGVPPRAATSVPGRILVRFRAGADAGDRAVARASVNATRARAFRLVPGLELLATTEPTDAALARLRARSDVAYAEPDFIVQATEVTDDPELSNLWGLEQPSDLDIDAPEAWDRTAGAGVVVAVIDSGVDLDHPDLAGNLWTNPDETPGNGMDDDDNGYVDDVHGWDFVQNDAEPDDANGHGTHVAGTIAAVGNNALGVVGVAHQARIMPVRMLDAEGRGTVSAGVAAIEYAYRTGARLSNNSWGWHGAASYSLEDAIRAANGADHLVVAAAGNAGVDTDEYPHFPSAYALPNVIAVAATDADDDLASFSNIGAVSVDVAAPGVAILSTEPGGGYQSMDGTSMASPHVSGVAALVRAAYPSWTVSQVRAQILRTVRRVPALAGVVATGGVVNAAAALELQPVTTAPIVRLPSSATLAQGKATTVVTLSGQNVGAYRLYLSANGGAWTAQGAASASRTRTVVLTPSSTTTYRFRVLPYSPLGTAGVGVTGSTFRVRVVKETASSAVAYSGTWRTASSASFHGGAVRHASSSTAGVTFRFTGREVALISTKASTRGAARIWIDGVSVGTVNLASTTTLFRQVAFRKAFGSSGTHTITVRPFGNGRVDIDGFLVLG